MTDAIGWLGAVCFAVCAIPQAVQSYKDGHSNGLSHSFLWLWWGGEVFMTVYAVMKNAELWPVIVNNSFNMLALLVIMRYKYFPRGK